MKTFETDIVIIGAGPVGLFAIFECGMVKLRCHVVDALPHIGGQCQALYPEKPIYDIPAHPNIKAGDLIAALEEQAAPFDPVYHLGHQVTGLVEKDGGWQVTTDKDHEITAKAVIIAAGVGAFGPNRPPLENLESYEGQSVLYMVKNPEDFRGQHVAIAGGGDSALDWAIILADIAEKVMLIHRRPKFRGAPDSVAKVEALADSGKIEMVVPYQLDALEGDDGKLQTLWVKTLEGERRGLPCDRLLAFFGLSMNLGPIAEWGLDFEQKHLAVNPQNMTTNRPGIYAIGDIATYPGKLKLILCGFSEAAMAAHHARSYIYPDQEFHFEYSTTQGVGGLEK